MTDDDLDLCVGGPLDGLRIEPKSDRCDYIDVTDRDGTVFEYEFSEEWEGVNRITRWKLVERTTLADTMRQ